jgi:hypothetical protein
LQTAIEVLMVFTNLHVLTFTNFSFTENALLPLLHNILWSMLFIFPFLLKTLGTQFAPPIFLFTMPISYQQNFNTINKQKKKKNKLQLFATILL